MHTYTYTYKGGVIEQYSVKIINNSLFYVIAAIFV